MRARRSVLSLLVGASLGIHSDPAAAVGRPEPRFDRGTAERTRAARPPMAGPPAELRAPRPRHESDPELIVKPAHPTRPDPRRPPQPLPSDLDIERRGYAEGARAFDDPARALGWQVLYRAGIFEGQRTALADPALGRGDYEQGLRLGRLDPEAREYGSREGAMAGEQAALRDAPTQVELQFLDLSWIPIASPRPGDARFEGTFPPGDEPELESLFEEYPIQRVTYLPRRMTDALSGGRWSPTSLHRCTSLDQVVEWTWQDAHAAFASWTLRPHRSGFWRSLESPVHRGLFEAAFARGFDDRLGAAYPALVNEAWGLGFEDGWHYGAVLRAEWSFRQGYVAGFDAGTVFAADVAFEGSYASAYDRAYQRAFGDWMDNPHPKLLSARLRDADDDGIFRPGEAVDAEFVLVNYGGVEGLIELQLAGAPLRSPSSIALRVPARRKLDRAQPLRAILAPDTHAPSQQTLVLSLPEDRLDLPVRVSYPMEFSGAISYESYPLEGRGVVRFEMVNRSRKAQEHVALLREGEAPLGSVTRRELGRVEPGGVIEAQLELEGAHPLDLLGGTLFVRAAVTAGGEVHDRKVARFPELATRLDHPDLVAYLVQLGRAPDASVDEIAGARRLLMQRFQADWSARGEEKGNAYESDLRDGGVRTAVGELVQAYRAEDPRARASLAFHGLDDEVEALAYRLEGVHPNLRRSMKKLARRLGS